MAGIIAFDCYRHWSSDAIVRLCGTEKTIEEVATLLASQNGNSKVLCGGTDVLVQLRRDDARQGWSLISRTSRNLHKSHSTQRMGFALARRHRVTTFVMTQS
jgi:hypothetical protein